MKKYVVLSATLTLIFTLSCSARSLAETPEITPLQEYQMIMAEEANPTHPPRAFDETELHQLAFGGFSTLGLTDGSKWDVGLYWSASSWKPGDVIRITFDYNANFFPLKFENLSQHKTVWGSVHHYKPWDANIKYSHEVIRIENDILTLNDGTQFRFDLNSPLFVSTWKVGDSVFVMGLENNKSYRYLLLNREDQTVISISNLYYHRYLFAEKIT